MKTAQLKSLAIAFVIALFFTACDGDFYVTERPVTPIYERPVSPGVGYIWVDGEWEWRGGRYEWRNGYWNAPRRQVWHPGHWNQGRGGWAWRKGYWR